MKNQLKYIAVLVGCLLVLAAQAQPEQILEDYKPSIELSMQVIALLELEQMNEQPLSTEQATVLMPVLEEFQIKPTISNEEATAYSERLSGEILTDEQATWVMQRADELFTENFLASNARPSISMGLGMRLMMGQQVNLVKEGVSQDALIELLNLISQKAN
jgi:hypothetical protein